MKVKESQPHLSVEHIAKTGNAAADALVCFALWVVGSQQEGGEPAHFAAVAVPCTDGNQVQRVPQTLTVVPIRHRIKHEEGTMSEGIDRDYKLKLRVESRLHVVYACCKVLLLSIKQIVNLFI